MVLPSLNYPKLFSFVFPFSSLSFFKKKKIDRLIFERAGSSSLSRLSRLPRAGPFFAAVSGPLTAVVSGLLGLWLPGSGVEAPQLWPRASLLLGV